VKKIVYFLFPILGLAMFIFFAYSETLERNLEAPGGEARNIQFHVGSEATIMGIVENLHYYGFIKNKKAFIHALKHTPDTTPGGQPLIEVGEGTIALNADYEISQEMDAWQLSDVLLNKATPNDCTHGCPGMFYPQLLPGGELAPTP